MRIPPAIRVTTTLFGLLVLPSVAQEPVRWRTGAAPLPSQSPAGVASALRSIAAQARPRHVVVQLPRAVDARGRELLAAEGVNLLQPLGGQAWFAAVDARAAVPGGFTSAGVRPAEALLAVQEIRAEWKMHPDLVAGRIPSHALLHGPAGTAPRVALYVVLHADVALGAGIERAVELDARVVDVLESINGLVLEIPRDRLGELVASDEVQWVEPPLPRLSDVAINDSNRVVTEANVVQAAPYGLSGAGVSVLVYDGGTARASHVDFGGRLTVRDGSGLINHATHVSGTIGGSGVAGGGTFRGMAPGVTIESYGFEYDGSGTFLYTNPGDLESDYDEAINVFGADISNNSIGTNTEPNGFPCNYQGDYGVCASLIDAVVRGSLGSPFRVVWANGNERQGSTCDLEGFGDFYSTAPPATAKNHITVGALNSNDDSMTSFSSWGPTDDGRMKPDVSAPGCQSSADFGVTSCGSASDTAYSTACGTSMASPTVTGLCSLLLEDYRAQFGGADPRNSTLKVLLAQAAQDRGNPGPDYQSGFGSVRIQATVDFMRLGRFREDALAGTGEAFVYEVVVPPGAPQLELTLAWDDVPGTPNVADALVNDLDLVVLDPASSQHFPWTLDPAAPSASAVQTQADHRNNIEQVTVDGPAAGTWRVEVRGFDVPSGPQPFSIASSHPIAPTPAIAIGVTGALPVALSPGSGTTVTASIRAVGGDAIVGGSPRLFFRYHGAGPFESVPMTPVLGDLYEADLPPPVCGATPRFYVRAEGVLSGPATAPPGAPANGYDLAVHEVTTLFADDFEADLGWTIQNVGLTDGPWGRGVPAGSGGRNDPLVDFDGSGACFLTDNVDGNSDVDGGPTRIMSPAVDLSLSTSPIVSYGRWFANDDFDADRMLVEISNDDGGSWVTVESVANTNGWSHHSFAVSDFVTPTATVRLRVSATDNPNDSVTEAAFDAVRIEELSCTTALPDCNGNGIVDADDIASGRSADANSDGIPDECAVPPTFGKRPPIRHP